MVEIHLGPAAADDYASCYTWQNHLGLVVRSPWSIAVSGLMTPTERVSKFCSPAALLVWYGFLGC
jgi:hypothetical protein